MNPNTASKPAKKVDVIVEVDNHTHAEQPVAKGDRISVSPATAARLVGKKIGRYAGVSTDAADTKKGAK